MFFFAFVSFQPVSLIYPGRFPDLASFRVLESILWLRGVGCG